MILQYLPDPHHRCFPFSYFLTFCFLSFIGRSSPLAATVTRSQYHGRILLKHPIQLRRKVSKHRLSLTRQASSRPGDQATHVTELFSSTRTSDVLILNCTAVG